MNEQETTDRIAAGRLQVAALHNALKAARGLIAFDVEHGEHLAEPVLTVMDEALSFGEPDGIAIFASMRSLVAAARDPERMGEVPDIADRIERLIGAHDGAV